MRLVIALIIGALGGVCVIMGILTTINVVPLISDGFTGIFWLVLGAVIFLALMAGMVVVASKELLDLLG